MMSSEELNRQRMKMAGAMARVARLQLRKVLRGMAKPRTYRLKKEARVLKSLIADARAAGILGGSGDRSALGAADSRPRR
jgi:hypothetical protein